MPASSLTTIWLLSAVLLSESLCEDTIFVDAPSAWDAAYLSCERRNMSLPVPMATDLSDMAATLPGDDSLHWAGGRYVHTPWRSADGGGVVRAEGCTHRSLLQGITWLHLSAEEPFQCLSKCNTPYVAMRERECSCLSRLPTQLVGESYCPFRCPSNLDVFCGGVFSVSLYAAVSTTVPWSSDHAQLQRECAFVHWDGAGSLQLRSDSCVPALTWQYKNLLCSPTAASAAIDAVETIFTTWPLAVHDCKTLGRQLLDVRGNDSLPSSLFSPTNPKDYWVGLSRQYVLKWINGSAAQEQRLGDHLLPNQGGECLAASRGPKGVFVSAVNCSRQLKFACVSKAQRTNLVTASTASALSVPTVPTFSGSTGSKSPVMTSSAYTSPGPPASSGSMSLRSTKPTSPRTTSPGTTSPKSTSPGSTSPRSTSSRSTSLGSTGSTSRGSSGSTKGTTSSKAASRGSSVRSSLQTTGQTAPSSGRTAGGNRPTSARVSRQAETTLTATTTTTTTTMEPATMSTFQNHGDSSSDLTPLWIILGIVGGLLIILVTVLVVVYTHRTSRRRLVQKEEPSPRDSRPRRSHRSSGTQRSRLSILEDPTFTFTETRPTSMY